MYPYDNFFTDSQPLSTVRGIIDDVVSERQDHLCGASQTIDDARALAKEGNPFPLVALQWPDLVIDDPEEAEFFEGEIGDSLNPCLRLDDWQRTTLAASFDVTVGEIAMKGCTGAGKGGVSGIMINLQFDVYDPCRINITSETFRHAQQNLFGEFSLWRRKMQHPRPGRLLTAELADQERHYVTVLNPSPHGKGEAFSGMHSERTVYVFDEASAIPQTHRDNALKNAALIIYLSNPRITEGMFRDLYRPMQGEGTKEERYERENLTGYCQGDLGRRLCVTIPGTDCKNVAHGRLKKPVAPLMGIEIGGKKYGASERISDEDFEKVKALIPGQMDLRQYQAIVHQSKEKWHVECYALARFPSENPTRQAILSSWLKYHVDAWRENMPVTAFGLDVARSTSGDFTKLSAGGVEGCKRTHGWQDDSNTRHVQKILRIAKKEYGIDLRDGDCPIVIEMGGGYGAAVYDRLEQLGCWVIQFVPAGRALVYPAIYRNQRTEWYMLLGRRLDPSDNWVGIPWGLPSDQTLHEDLTSPVKTLQPSGQWGLEPKEDIAKRLGRSPDDGDSVVCLWRGVFERHNLLDKMNENVKDVIVSAGYDEESGDEEVDDVGEIVSDIESDDFQLPAPATIQSEDETLQGILESFGHSEEDDDEGKDAPQRWDEYFE